MSYRYPRLQLEQLRIQPYKLHQPLVRPLFNQLPALQHQDLVRHHDRRERDWKSLLGTAWLHHA